jgi:hypothetical protein
MELLEAMMGCGSTRGISAMPGTSSVPMSKTPSRWESGVDTESPAGHMVRFRKGKIVHMRSFRDPEAALEAVGLRE